VVEGEEKSCWATALADPLQSTLMQIGARTAECDRSTIQRHLLHTLRWPCSAAAAAAIGDILATAVSPCPD